MTIRLRPHHLLCTLTYMGKGYTPAFTVNMTNVVTRLARGEPIEIVEGPDDICAPVLNDMDSHCQQDSIRERDERARKDVSDTLGIPIQTGATLLITRDQLHRLRHAFRTRDLRSACHDCQWNELCSDIADSGYRDATW